MISLFARRERCSVKDTSRFWHTLFPLFAVPLLFALLSACGTVKRQKNVLRELSTFSDQQEAKISDSSHVLVINLAHSMPAGSAVDRIAGRFKTILEEKSQGTIRVDIFPDDTLGYVYDYADALNKGTVDAWIGSGKCPMINILSWAPTITGASLEEINSFIASDVVQQRIQEESASAGIDVLNIYPAQYRLLSTNQNISTLADLQKLRIRCFSDTSLESVYWSSFHIPTAAYDIHELYAALQQNMVDAEANPLSVIVSSHLYEQQSHLLHLKFMVYCDGLFISRKFMLALDENQRSLIRETADELTDYAARVYDAEQVRCTRIVEKAGLRQVYFPPNVLEEMRRTAAPAMENSLNLISAEDVQLMKNFLGSAFIRTSPEAAFSPSGTTPSWYP